MRGFSRGKVAVRTLDRPRIARGRLLSKLADSLGAA